VKLRTASRLGLATVAVAVIPLTAACQTRIGEAASVAGHQIETSQLTAVTGRSEAVLAKTGQTVASDQRDALQRAVLTLLVRDSLLTELARLQGVSVSPAEINTERAREAQQAGGDSALVQQSEQSGVSATDIDIAIRYQLLLNKLATKFGSADATALSNKLAASAQQVKVRINPRFGSWDPKNLTIVGASDDLASTLTRK
jgi:hypothetical protein